MSSQLQVTGEAKIRDIQGPVVANSGVITALDGAASQYVRGDGTLADFPTSTGGGSSVSYYLNSSVSQGTIGGVAYRQLSKTPISGAGTDITVSTNGYIASYITDANDPSLLEVPAGNFNCEFYFSVNSNNHNPYVYAELYKYNGTTFTLLGTSQSIPEYLSNGTTLSAYYFAIPVAVAALTITDRLAIRIYANVDGRVVTLHTENNHLCQVVTTFSKGLTTLNNLTRQVQFLGTGTSGTDFNIASSVATHTFNLPVASATNTGKLSSTDWSTFNNKVPYTGASANVDLGGNSLYFNNGQAIFGRNFTGTTAYALIGVNPSNKVSIDTSALGAVFGGDVTCISYIANGLGSQGGTIALKQNGLMSASTGYTTLGSLSAGQLIIYFGDANLYAATFLNTSLTDSRSYTLPNLSGTLALLEGTQTFTGAKTFTGSVSFNSSLQNSPIVNFGLALVKGNTPSATSGIWSQLYSASGNNNLVVADNSNTSKLQFQAASSYDYTFPAASGTIALTSNINYPVTSVFGRTGAVVAANGDYTTSQITEGTNLYYTEARVNANANVAANTAARHAAVTIGTANGLSLSTQALSLAAASTSTTGALTSTDWNTFNGKQAALNGTGFVKISGTTISYDNSTYLTTSAASSTYLPLSGGTLTGALSGTSATFTSSTASTTTANGALVVTGGVGIGGEVNIAGTTIFGTSASGNSKFYIYGGFSAGLNLLQNYNGSVYTTEEHRASDYSYKIGTTPAFTIASTGAATFSSSVTARSGLSGTNTGFATNDASGFGVGIGYVSGSYGYVTSQSASSPLVLAIDGGEKMRITTGGNVGIGISTPFAIADINTSINGAGSSALQLGVGGTRVAQFFATSGEVRLSAVANVPMLFYTNDTERMRITSGGRFVYGSTTADWLFNIAASSSGYILNSHNTRNTSGDVNALFQLGNNCNNTSSYFLVCSLTAGDKFYIYGNGTYTSVSDKKLKKNISKVTDTYLDKVLGLNIVNYNWKEQEDGSPLELGMIAQEVEELIPSIVHEGRKQEDGNIYKGIQVSSLPYILIKAIQEQQAQIEELKAKIK